MFEVHIQQMYSQLVVTHKLILKLTKFITTTFQPRHVPSYFTLRSVSLIDIQMVSFDQEIWLFTDFLYNAITDIAKT